MARKCQWLARDARASTLRGPRTPGKHNEKGGNSAQIKMKEETVARGDSGRLKRVDGSPRWVRKRWRGATREGRRRKETKDDAARSRGRVVRLDRSNVIGG